MRLWLVFVVGLTLCRASPVRKVESPEKPAEDSETTNGLEDYMEYHRYLKEVVNALESDPDFRKKLESAEESYIRSGKIAEDLEFVSHHVRTRLDEIKRMELERLRDLTEKKMQITNDLDDNKLPDHRHLDHSNPHTFEIDDLKRLIAKTTEDLAAADKRRKKDFKEYELQKEYEKQAKLNKTNGEERSKLEKEFREREEKHKKHERLHEPGHKAQLEEVWEEQDQMQQEFDPRTFFMLHDLDSNGLWDQNEVKSLFIKELDKMYQAGAPEDDMRERVEEMERMRETVFSEVDTNQDGFIDFNEFVAQTKKSDYQQDRGWRGLDEQKPYTDEELQAYIQQHQMAQAQAQQAYAQQQHQQPPPHPQLHYPNQAVPQQVYQQPPYHQPAYNHPVPPQPLHNQPPPQQIYHQPPQQQVYNQPPQAAPQQQVYNQPPQAAPQQQAYNQPPQAAPQQPIYNPPPQGAPQQPPVYNQPQPPQVQIKQQPDSNQPIPAQQPQHNQVQQLPEVQQNINQPVPIQSAQPQPSNGNGIPNQQAPK